MMKNFSALCLAFILVISMFGCGKESYGLTLDDPYNLIYEPLQNEYRTGEKVTVKTYVVYDADAECFVNGKSIGKQTAVMTNGEYTHWEFYFEMPDEDVTLTIKTVGSKEL